LGWGRGGEKNGCNRGQIAATSVATSTGRVAARSYGFERGGEGS